MTKASGRGRQPSYFLSDGTSLIDIIASRGLNPVTVYSRMRRGMSPDDAVSLNGPRIGRRPVAFLADGTPLADAIRAAGVSKRCVYQALEHGSSPDDALASIVNRPRRRFKDGRALRSS